MPEATNANERNMVTLELVAESLVRHCASTSERCVQAMSRHSIETLTRTPEASGNYSGWAEAF